MTSIALEGRWFLLSRIGRHLGVSPFDGVSCWVADVNSLAAAEGDGLGVPLSWHAIDVGQDDGLKGLLDDGPSNDSFRSLMAAIILASILCTERESVKTRT